MKEFWDWLVALFTTPAKEYTYISHIPRYGANGTHVSLLQAALIALGYKIIQDGKFGPQTERAVIALQKSLRLPGSGVIGNITLEALSLKVGEKPVTGSKLDNPAYLEAKKYAGKKESDTAWSKFLSGFWKIVGLPGYSTIRGNTYAWCGLFVAAMLSLTGLKWQKDGAGAKNWDKYGQTINWRENGIPRGAVVRINHKKSCTAGSGNHVAFADADCTASDLTKSGAVIPLFGGNQSDQVKRSIFSAGEICEAKWPSELPLPDKVTKSVNCDGKAESGESTR
jgi:peptidoglycan hydrolase-like protein with peptidoglycan-binding domain